MPVTFYNSEIWPSPFTSRLTTHCTFLCLIDKSVYTSLNLNPRQTKPDLKDLFWYNRWRCNPIRPWEMVEGWEERREAADSVFLFPVVCWLSVMRPRLRPRRPVIGQGIRWLPREAWPGWAASSGQKTGRQTRISRNNADTKKEKSPALTCLLCGWLTTWIGSWNIVSGERRKKYKEPPLVYS